MSVSNTNIVKRIARQLGFDYVGISKAEFLAEDAIRLEDWLNTGGNGKMSYMENHFDKRVDPTKLVEGSKSVVSLLYNYHTKLLQKDTNAPKLAKYAYGEDYHFVIRDKLNEFFYLLQQQIGAVEGRSFVDSAPILDRAWARKSGLGWIGKNSMLINKHSGSDFFIAELVIDLKLEADGPLKDYCGTCTKCLDSCPTDAILPHRQIDSNKCISYATIELKDERLPNEFRGKMQNWMFGCDICQDVCPWNRFGKQNTEERFQPRLNLLDMTKNHWEYLGQEDFSALFQKSAVKRTKFIGLKRNIEFLK
ncbi:tRNA epoxyqueuosine(34) reductase QueG [Vicingaceae bacterium]|nr:tRNA epoxyqueuosine(34) reductase QueG [Vicingaceae bacterium]MDC0005012.1 tRNA epoxyqueuosine(34) reductase QueG [bacterium]MDC1452246.1 tRNA epoxyqueuosine(34) reductase QueG [Vicingaceae bacterium]